MFGDSSYKRALAKGRVRESGSAATLVARPDRVWTFGYLEIVSTVELGRCVHYDIRTRNQRRNLAEEGAKHHDLCISVNAHIVTLRKVQ